MRTIWWEDGQVKMIDQRVLPLHFQVTAYRDYREVARAITDMVIRGAPAIGAAGGYAMALAARQSQARDCNTLLVDLAEAKQVIDAARPTAVNLAWATQRLMDQAQQLALSHDQSTGRPAMDNICAALLVTAERLADQDVAVNRRLGAIGAAVLPSHANILHHCNTGSLATVDYGTALGVVRAAWEQGNPIHVWVDETRPRLQGARLTAWELMQAGIPMHLIADNAAGHLMRTGRVDVVLFGADRVAANGDVANKIGTYQVAVLAKENGIPCYCAAPTSTVDLNTLTGDDTPIEERPWDEVTVIDGAQIAPDDAPVYNPAFDITPHRYLTGIITEEGVCYPPFTVSLPRAKATAEASLREA